MGRLFRSGLPARSVSVLIQVNPHGSNDRIPTERLSCYTPARLKRVGHGLADFGIFDWDLDLYRDGAGCRVVSDQAPTG